MPRRLEGDRPQSNSWAFGGVVCCGGKVGGNFLIQTSIYWRGTGQRYIGPILKNIKIKKNRNITIDAVVHIQYEKKYSCRYRK